LEIITAANRPQTAGIKDHSGNPGDRGEILVLRQAANVIGNFGLTLAQNNRQ